MLLKKKAFAIKAHGDQLYGANPYAIHLDHVVAILSNYGETAQVISYLHDVVEDTDVSIEDIKVEFGVFIADCISILTDEIGKNRQERKIKTYAKMAKVSGKLELALVVKAADRLANLTACFSDNNIHLLNMYKQEHEVFKSSVQRDGLASDIWQKIDQLLIN